MSYIPWYWFWGEGRDCEMTNLSTSLSTIKKVSCTFFVYVNLFFCAKDRLFCLDWQKKATLRRNGLQKNNPFFFYKYIFNEHLVFFNIQGCSLITPPSHLTPFRKKKTWIGVFFLRIFSVPCSNSKTTKVYGVPNLVFSCIFAHFPVSFCGTPCIFPFLPIIESL